MVMSGKAHTWPKAIFGQEGELFWLKIVCPADPPVSSLVWKGRPAAASAERLICKMEIMSSPHLSYDQRS